MTIRFSKPFLRQYRKLPTLIQRKVDQQIQHLSQDIRHPAVKARKMVNKGNIWEGRVDRSFRFTFNIETDKLIFRRVGTYEIYRKP